MAINQKFILSLVDLTSLNVTDTPSQITLLCDKAMSLKTAAVCVYPQFVNLAAIALKKTSIKIATVANFPQGIDSLEVVISVIQKALDQGADEIDVVFPYTWYLSWKKQQALDLISACKKVCESPKILKVILETGILVDPKIIESAARDVLLAGADFLKTSTGKVSIGATLSAAEIMLTMIKKHKPTAGFKAAGGVRTFEQAMQYITLAEKIMGKNFVIPEHFRIGASQLVVADAK